MMVEYNIMSWVDNVLRGFYTNIICISNSFKVSVIWEQNATKILNVSGSLAQECSQKVNYKGKVCYAELAQWQLCFLGPQDTNGIYVPALSDHQEIEADARQLLSSIRLLDPSSECVAAFQAFLCLELFGLCDANNQLHQVTQTDCVRLTTDVCRREFNFARNFLGVGVLPSCDSFQNQESQCIGIILS